MQGSGSGRAALAAAAAWVCAAAFHPALVQAQTSAVMDFDIPAQPMASALNTWAVQANAQVFVDPGQVARLTAPAVKGSLAPRQALHALLLHSNLVVIQGADGVLVIKPRPATAAAAPAQPPLSPAVETPAASAPAPAAVTTARDTEGPWLLRLDGDYLEGNGTASGGATAAVAAEYFFTDHVAGAATTTAPRTVSFGSVSGSVSLQSSTLTLKYYPAPQTALRPYVGAGIAVTALYGATGGALERATVGPAAEVGLDLRLGAHWMLNANVSWTQVRPELTADPAQQIRLDPLQVGLGVVYRFGAAARAAALDVTFLERR